MSSYMLIHGDCMDSFGLIHDHSVNLVLADPPYGITQNTWDVVLPFDDFIEYDGKISIMRNIYCIASKRTFPTRTPTRNGIKENNREFGHNWTEYLPIGEW